MSLEERFRNEALEQLKELLRIPSISALPEHKDDIQKAADFVEAALKRAGMSTTTQVRRGDGNPLVYGAIRSRNGRPRRSSRRCAATIFSAAARATTRARRGS
jgi:acetylornithine deacetylase/succinyl-diaminopimelate desuccinylase-like protein